APADAHDALLVVATSGRWQTEFSTAWRPPWDLRTRGRLRTVPLGHEASYGNWADTPLGVPESPYYPVFLDPWHVRAVARELMVGAAVLTGVVARRATGGLPLAVTGLKGMLRGRRVEPGARDVLAAADWDGWLTKLGLTDQLPNVTISDFVTAAPFAT